MQTVARLESSDISNPASRLRNLDCEIWSLAAWSIHGWVFSLAAEPAPQLLKALQNYNENKPAKRPHPWEPPRRTLCRTLARWLVLRLLQQSQFNAFHKKLTKPEEIEALSVQMFVARLTKKQDKYLVHIRPDHAARVAWNEAIAAIHDLALSQGALSRSWHASPRWSLTPASRCRLSGWCPAGALRCLRSYPGIHRITRGEQQQDWRDARCNRCCADTSIVRWPPPVGVARAQRENGVDSVQLVAA